MQKQPILINDYAGGWVTEKSSDILQLNQSPNLINAEINVAGQVTKMFGFTEIGSDSENSVIGDIMTFPNRNGNDWLFKFCGTVLKVYDETLGLWVVVQNSLTANQKWGHAMFNNVAMFGSQVDSAFQVDLGINTRLTTATNLGDTTVNVVDTSKFPTSGAFFLNNVAVTYVGVTPTSFTGCANVVATPLNSLIFNDSSFLTNVPKGNIYEVFGGRLLIAGVLASGASTVYGSKATDPSNFTVGSGADNAFILPCASKVNSIRVFLDDNSAERAMIFCNNNQIYALDVQDDGTLNTTLTPVTSFKQGVTTTNHFSTLVGNNDVYHIDIYNQVRTLGPRNTEQTGSTKNFSDSISKDHKTFFRYMCDFSLSKATICNSEYWLLAKNTTDPSIPYNNVIFIYDENLGVWKKRENIYAGAIATWKGQVVLSDAALNKVYVVDPTNPNDGSDGATIFEYHTPDVTTSQLNFEKIPLLKISGILSVTGNITVEIWRDYMSVLLGKFTISGSNSDITGVAQSVETIFGSTIFGKTSIGGSLSDTQTFFLATLKLKGLPDCENVRVVIKNDERDVYIRINNVKLTFLPMPESYVPANYILTPNK